MTSIVRFAVKTLSSQRTKLAFTVAVADVSALRSAVSSYVPDLGTGRAAMPSGPVKAVSAPRLNLRFGNGGTVWIWMAAERMVSVVVMDEAASPCEPEKMITIG